MRVVLPGFILFLAGTCWLSAQSLSDSAVTTTNQINSPSLPATNTANTTNTTPTPAAIPAAVTTPNAAVKDDADEEGAIPASDFLIKGVPYAKVLYLEGKVWIKSPTDVTFHQLAEDEPIAAQSIIYTGINGILDFATGPGMAIRMVPQTLVRVAELPTPATLATSTTTAPETSAVGVKKGTIFSALGRANGEPIDYQVRTPAGVAGARGTMFSTTATADQTQVSMLHGTVSYETPDHQKSQITAGQSQQISGGTGGKYQLAPSKALDPAKSADFLNHAGGLLEHASGSGVVRRSLGPDVAKTLHDRGYNMPAATQQRFQNAAKARTQHPPAFNSLHGNHAAGTGVKPTGVTPTATRPATTTTKTSTTPAGKRATATDAKPQGKRRYPAGAEDGVERRSRGWGQ